MKKQLILLLLVSLVVGMIAPAMANPQASGSATSGNNWKSLVVNPTAWNMATSPVSQGLTSNGAQSNSATTTSRTGDAMGFNPAMASTGALQVTGSADNSGRDSDPWTGDNNANGNTASAASGTSNVNSGDSGQIVVQGNGVTQGATAVVATNQGNSQFTMVHEYQDSSSSSNPSVDIDDSNIVENNNNNEQGFGDIEVEED